MICLDDGRMVACLKTGRATSSTPGSQKGILWNRGNSEAVPLAHWQYGNAHRKNRSREGFLDPGFEYPQPRKNSRVFFMPVKHSPFSSDSIGIDAKGKDGVTKHVFSVINPQGCTVSPLKVPTEEEPFHDVV